MCKTTHFVDQPMNPGPAGGPALQALPGPTGPSTSADPTMPTVGNDPLEQSIQSEINASAPKTGVVTRTTKFGHLLHILEPMLEGGMIGAFGGRNHPSGGFGAAQDFYTQRRAQQLHEAILQRQNLQAQAQIAERARTNDIAQERADAEDWGQPVQGQDANGNPAFFVRNRRTGETKQVNGFNPPDKPDKPHYEMTDQGLMAATGTTATPVTLPGAPSAVPQGPPASTGVVTLGGQPSPMFLARRPGSGIRPGAPVGSAPGGTVLHAPGYGKPQHENDFERFYNKYLDDNELDDTSANQLKARAAFEAAGRKPETDGNLTGKAYTKRQSQYIDQLNRGFASTEAQRQKDLKALAKDPTLTPDEMTSKQQQIEEENADRKQTLHQRIVDAASSQGIDIGEVPDYRAQLTGGGQTAGRIPTGPPSSGRSSGGKVAGSADVAAWAQKKGISINAARRQFKSKGYAIQGSSQ